MKKIIIDIYGADAGAEVVINGTAGALKRGLRFFPVMVGEKKLIDSAFLKSGISDTAYEVIETTDFIGADEPPTAVFGGRDEASMVKAFGRLKADDECSALLSAGNTGALLVGSICRLGLAAGLKFPALASALPCAGEELVCLVDCGANMKCSARDLASFARMGNVFCKCFCGIAAPRVGLMSVGREKGKGNELTKQAFEEISALPLNFVGNLEGSDMVSGYADVIVTDGFAGNLLLKNTEAAGKAALAEIEKLGLDGASMQKIRETIYKKFDFNSRGAATFLGTQKTVVKMHGCANEETVISSIDQILRLENADFSEKIAEEMAKTI